jgi:hypothetical protein
VSLQTKTGPVDKSLFLQGFTSKISKNQAESVELGVTNVLRCLQLEAHGYQVNVTELVGWEHSMKNELIIASDKNLPRKRPIRAAQRGAGKPGAGGDAGALLHTPRDAMTRSRPPSLAA